MPATTLRKPQQKNGSNGHKAAASRTVQMKQSDVPSISLEEALRVPRALADEYAGRPTSVLNVAAAMSMQPSSGPFRTLTGAAVAYGLTSGTAFSDEIALTPLGKRIVKPTSEGDDVAARREALLKPRVVGEFLKRYNGATIPRDDIALNVLEEIGVPEQRTQAVFKLIIDAAQSVGLIRDIKGKRYITVEGVPQSSAPAAASLDAGEGEGTGESGEDELTVSLPGAVPPTPAAPVQQSGAADKAAKRVYITHGKNRSLVDTIKKLLTFGELEAVVSVERPTVSQPVPDKIMGEMRSCGAAIIHVDAEQKLMDAEANEHVALNPNVLMEIGAAMALFGRRFILLVKDGIKLPSNLQGLYEVRYAVDTLDSESTVKLLEAIRDIKNHAMPERYSS